MYENNLRNRFHHEEVTILDHGFDRNLLLNATEIENAKNKALQWFEDNRNLAIGIGVAIVVVFTFFCCCICRRRK